MKPTTIRELRDETPFRAFDIHLADGRALAVATRDHLMISPTSQEFALYLPDGTLNVVDAALITSITRKPRRKTAST